MSASKSQLSHLQEELNTMTKRKKSTIPEGALPVLDKDNALKGYIDFPEDNESILWEFVIFEDEDKSNVVE